MDILGCVTARLSNDDSSILVIPLQNGAQTDTKSLTNLGRNRNLALHGEFRMSESHVGYYRGHEDGNVDPDLAQRCRTGLMTESTASSRPAGSSDWEKNRRSARATERYCRQHPARREFLRCVQKALAPGIPFSINFLVGAWNMLR
jgi:hypothetical protein